MNPPRDAAILTNDLESAPAYTAGTPLTSVRTALIRGPDSSHSFVEPEKQLGYIGEQSLMAGPRSEDSPRTESAHLASMNDRLLHVSGALIPPGKVLLEAAKDSYQLRVRSRVPVIEESDLALDSLPILLQQSLCLVHALLRRPGLSSISVVPGEEHYIKVKTLLSTNHERNNITALKAMCLLHCWNMSPPDIVTLDSSWSCLGMAIRYALHMGLHKESTYARFQSPRVARRIAWYLFVREPLSQKIMASKLLSANIQPSRHMTRFRHSAGTAHPCGRRRSLTSRHLSSLTSISRTKTLFFSCTLLG